MMLERAIVCGVLVVSHAFAWADAGRSLSLGERIGLRAMFAQRTAFEIGRSGDGDQQPAPRPEAESRSQRDGSAMDSSGSNGYVGHPDQHPGSQAGGKGGKMSPEERRALRRQIDEAGQDIYKSRR
jgi:uncharacterized membrane protein